MKVSRGGINLRLSLSAVLLFVVIRSEQVHCAPPASLATTSSPSDGPQAGDPSIPPLIFPKDGSGYKVVENETALKILQSRAEAETKQPAPEKEGQNVPQLPAADDESISNNGTSGSSKQQSVAAASQVGYDEIEDNDDDNDYSTEDDDDNDDEVEEVQPEDPNREDGLEEQFGDKDHHYPLVIDNTMIEVSAMRQEHIWVIMVGAIIVLALAAYIGMVMYRNRLENRYGMRQRLVNEDDYYTNNDI